MKPIELINEIQAPKKKRGSILLGLLLLMAGYWITNQAITGYHKGIKILSAYIIQHDLAEMELNTELTKGVNIKIDERIVYTTALKLDRCLDSLEQVRQSIEPFHLGGPEQTPKH